MAKTVHFETQAEINQYIVREVEKLASAAEATEGILMLLVSCIRDEGYIDKVRLGELLDNVHSRVDEDGPEAEERRDIMKQKFAAIRDLATGSTRPDLTIISGGRDEEDH